jgi:DNA-binding HxlR family transcriptional regulator
MLTVRLRSLETAGIVTRRQYPEIPVRVEYALADQGRDLAPVIHEMGTLGPALGNAVPSLGRGAGRYAGRRGGRSKGAVFHARP